MKTIVYIFALVLSAVLAINFSIASLILITLLSGFVGIVIAGILELSGLILAVGVFIFVRNRIIKSFITDNN